MLTVIQDIDWNEDDHELIFNSYGTCDKLEELTNNLIHGTVIVCNCSLPVKMKIDTDNLDVHFNESFPVIINGNVNIVDANANKHNDKIQFDLISCTLGTPNRSITIGIDCTGVRNEFFTNNSVIHNDSTSAINNELFANNSVIRHDVVLNSYSTNSCSFLEDGTVINLPNGITVLNDVTIDSYNCKGMFDICYTGFIKMNNVKVHGNYSKPIKIRGWMSYVDISRNGIVRLNEYSKFKVGHLNMMRIGTISINNINHLDHNFKIGPIDKIRYFMIQSASKNVNSGYSSVLAKDDVHHLCIKCREHKKIHEFWYDHNHLKFTCQVPEYMNIDIIHTIPHDQDETIQTSVINESLSDFIVFGDKVINKNSDKYSYDAETEQHVITFDEPCSNPCLNELELEHSLNILIKDSKLTIVGDVSKITWNKINISNCKCDYKIYSNGNVNIGYLTIENDVISQFCADNEELSKIVAE